ncbi:DUF91 domain-containing protein [Candidatus Poribacteria bacterium]|nr:DUF91 domain-containing protein [Candidatus Poribacteria bacterium]MYK22662.1 DUF91 domain-containing protein [Candidatus Poribacteria bacterium]
MATDYKKIVEDHEKRYGWDAKPRRIYKRLYSDKTHFIYELIQNADDSKSQHLKLQLDSNALLVWNDGRQFNERDVRSICSLGSSDKDLTNIGTFGIGFKAVYNYTDFPEIYSDDERFCIRDFIKPEGIDEMTTEIAELVNEGKTVFRLPLKDSLHQDDIDHLKVRLCNLSKERSLLFLRHLESVEWKDEHNAQKGSYACHRCRYDKIQNVPENESVELVELTGSLNGNNELSETFLVFRKKIHPPKYVIDQLLEQAEDEEEQQSIQQSAEELQPIEVAFKLQDDRITAMDDNCVLFAYLPTQKETHLKFLIQARYQTTPARDNIPKPSENLWNRWLVQETAKLLPEILEQLKASGLLEPAFFNVLPLKGEVENEFKPIAEALQKVMGERAFVPTQDGGYAKAENVFYPESTPLRKLVKSSGMHSDSSLLHPDIRKDAKEFERCFDVMAKAGVKEIKASDLLCWLEEQSCKWFKNRTNKWLCSLYIYFNRKWNKSELERINKLPLVRLENGEHVCVSDQLVYFPLETYEDREEIGSFLNELPILRTTLLKGKNRNDIADFLESIGVKKLHPENLISESICPLYRKLDKPAVMKNRQHVRYIFKSWQKVNEKGTERGKLEGSVSEIPILRAYKGIQRETSDFVVPCDAYLPQAYTGDNDLETYFSVSDGAPWFVDDKYLTNKSDTKAWHQFLKAIGTNDTPLIFERGVTGSIEECKKRGITHEDSTKPFEGGKSKDIWYRRPYQYFDGHIVDRYLVGLSQLLTQISRHNEKGVPQALWGLLVKFVNPLPSEEWQRNSFFRVSFQGIYRWFYQTDRSKPFDADFYRQLKETAWIPDEQGSLRTPSECFVPTSENRKVLGDIVFYLPDSFRTNTAAARWLAEKLGVDLNADADSVLNYLQTMSHMSQGEVSVEDVEPIYKFLESQDEPLWGFEDEPFIFIPEPEPRWWRIDEVFWEDESAVFGGDRGYLKAHYSEDLKSFFTTSLDIPEHAAPLDYVRGIKDVASTWQIGEEIRERVKILYDCLWLSLQKNEDLSEDEEWQEEWEQVREDACWLGRTGDEWGFFLLEELVWNDHNYCAEVVEDEVPFWAFGDDLLEFAKHLGVEGCYQASNIEFDCYSDQGECTIESEKVQKLVPYIHDFLNSTPWRGVYSQEETAEILDRLSVRRAKKLEVSYRLKGSSIPDPRPRQSFLDPTSQGTILWLGLEESKGAYPDLIGDALQDHFRINELREFIKDLLLTTDSHRTTLLNWERRGFEPDRCLSPPELDSKEGDKNVSESVDEKFSDEKSVEDYSGTDDSESETPMVHEDPKTGSEGSDSTGDKSDTPTHRPRPGKGGARWPGGSGGNTPNRSTDTGYGGGGRGEGEKHRSLKEYLANNSSLFGEGLELIDTEYRFRSSDEADILFEDSSGNPVTVEVKPPISSGSDQEVWQAVKYKHLAAVEYGLPCEQVRSILAAPEIPDDVKEKCEELGIEPFKVTQR